MNKQNTLILLSLTTLLSACDNDYTPVANASGEDIFKAACAECHKADKSNPKILYSLAPEKANQAAIADKISNGSMMMPRFPNIKGEQLSSISEYVLSHSSQK